jgi:hypothetical protein
MKLIVLQRLERVVRAGRRLKDDAQIGKAIVKVQKVNQCLNTGPRVNEQAALIYILDFYRIVRSYDLWYLYFVSSSMLILPQA